MSLGLGSVQFGSAYGVTNAAARKTPPDEVESILRLAAERGIRVIDTACGYGDAEAVLGRSISSFGGRFDIVTKTPVFRLPALTRDHAAAVRQSLRRSLERLRQERVYGLLAHHADDLLSDGGGFLVDELRAIAADGLAQKVGVSVYRAEQIDAVLALFVPDLVQLPLNVLDRRLLRSRHVQRLSDLGVEIHARSVFLQGAILSPSESLPEALGPLRRSVDELGKVAKERGLSSMQAALKFVLDRPEVSVALVGVTKLSEFRQILEAVAALPEAPLQLPPVTVIEERLLDPSNWQPGN